MLKLFETKNNVAEVLKNFFNALKKGGRARIHFYAEADIRAEIIYPHIITLDLSKPPKYREVGRAECKNLVDFFRNGGLSLSKAQQEKLYNINKYLLKANSVWGNGDHGIFYFFAYKDEKGDEMCVAFPEFNTDDIFSNARKCNFDDKQGLIDTWRQQLEELMKSQKTIKTKSADTTNRGVDIS